MSAPSAPLERESTRRDLLKAAAGAGLTIVYAVPLIETLTAMPAAAMQISEPPHVQEVRSSRTTKPPLQPSSRHLAHPPTTSHPTPIGLPQTGGAAGSNGS